MKHASLNQKPSFMWQGLLILLPVVVMAGVGLISLRQDKLLAEKDAEETSALLAQHLAKNVAGEMALQLRDYFAVNMDAHILRTSAFGFSILGPGFDRAKMQAHIQEWEEAHPGLSLSALPKIDCQASLAGQIHPREYRLSPQPPVWLGELTVEQLQAWRGAQTEEFASGDLKAAQSAIERFLALKPPRGGEANAELLKLRLLARQEPAEKTAGRYAASLWANSPELTETGFPVGQLICFQALRLTADHSGVPKPLLSMIPWAIEYAPSYFSPQLIAEVQRVAGPPGSDSAKLSERLHAWWNPEEAARQVLINFRDQNPADAWGPKAYWTTLGEDSFMLAFERGDNPWAYRFNSASVPQGKSIPYWTIRIFPKKVVGAALADAVVRVNSRIPPYAKASLAINGTEFDVESGAVISRPEGAALRVLAEASGMLDIMGTRPEKQEYPIHVKVFLANSEVLFARQRQRTLLFGALILASVLAAAVGYLAARRAFYRQLHLSEMKSNFVSSVSHELRAPIASVRLMAEGLERGKVSEPVKQREYFGFIVQECRRLSSLIENVLDFSRIEQGRKQYEIESTDLAALTAQTVKLMETYAAERQVSIIFQQSGMAASVELDGKAMQQALINLIDNAIKHSPKGSTVSVGLDFGPGITSLWVEDKGDGIAAEEHERIFERFYRVGSELRRETQGVGIGLSIVKHIVEAHGGKVLVRSLPGQGSRFTIEMPVNGVRV